MARADTPIGRRGRRAPAANGDLERALCDAAERLMAERSFAELSVADILKEAGVSRASFYFYFASKYALLAALTEHVVDEIYDATQTWLHRADGEPPYAALHAAMRAVLALWRTHGPVLRAMVESGPADPGTAAAWQRLTGRFTDAATEQIERERAAGIAPADGPPARSLAAMLTWMTERCLYLALSDAEPAFAADRQLVETLTSVWWRAIYAPAPAVG